jgi:flagellar basal body-associated protein FliL
MAKEEKKPEDAPDVGALSGAATGGGKKKGILMGGGLVSLIALAWVLSMVAVPTGDGHGRVRHTIKGPFMADISPSAGFQVNLSGDGGKHYLSMNLKVEVDAFEEAYATARATEPLYQAKLTDAVLRTASQKTKTELDSAVGREVFRDELRVALDPVLFPVHVGNEHEVEGRHDKSGLRAGRSIASASMRGYYYEHELHLNTATRTIALDDGRPLSYQGDETDMFVPDARGKGVYVDVSGVNEEFTGDIPVGSFGRVRNVYFNTLLTQ